MTILRNVLAQITSASAVTILLSVSACGGENGTTALELEETSTAEQTLLSNDGGTSRSNLDEWAFAWSSQLDADHTANSSYSRTSNGNVQAQIDHQGTGLYAVTFPGVGVHTGGVVLVSAYGSDNRRCKVSGWGSSSAGLTANLRCFATTGALANSRFTISYHRQHSYNFSESAYLWADQPTNPDYTPAEAYQYHSRGAANRVRRTAQGVYQVTVPYAAQPLVTAQATAYGPDASYCNVSSWLRAINDRVINVRCFDTSGAPVDSRFTLHYQAVGTNLGTSGAWARVPGSGSSNTYDADVQATTVDACGSSSSERVRVERIAAGRYRVNYPRTSPTLAINLVTANGTGNGYCKVRSWGSGTSGTHVDVDCYAPNGQLADSAFLSHMPSANACPTASAASVAVRDPLESQAVLVQRTGPEYPGGPSMARMSLFLEVRNTGPTRSLQRVDVGGVPVIWYRTPQAIASGRSLHVQNSLSNFDGDPFLDSSALVLPYPLPQPLAVEAFFSDGTRVNALTPSFTRHVNAGGPLRFHGDPYDLRENETWSGSSDHPAGHQVFALDLGLMGWNGSGFDAVFRGYGRESKQNYRVYGLPVYAMADGVVCFALNDHSERSWPEEGDAGMSPSFLAAYPQFGGFNGGGNEVFVRTGDEVVVYAHLQPGSIPSNLLTMNAPVRRGQYLGKVGLAGSTGAPHIHVHVKTALPNVPDPARIKNGCDDGQIRPLHFADVRTLPVADAHDLAVDGDLDAADFSLSSDGSFPHPYSLLMPPGRSFEFNPQAREDATYFGVYQSSNAIETRIKAESWSAFTTRWDTLSRDGFRLFAAETVVEDGVRKFIGLMRRGTFNHSLIGRAGYTAFQADWQAQRNAGMRLVDLTVYSEGGTEHFIGVFHADTQTQDLRVQTGWSAFTADYGARHAAGMRLVDVETVPGSGGRRYFAVYRAGNWAQALMGQAGWTQFSDIFAQQTNQRMRLSSFEAYRESNQEHFIGVFDFGDQGIHLKRVSDYGSYILESEQSATVGLRAIDVAAFDD